MFHGMSQSRRAYALASATQYAAPFAANPLSFLPSYLEQLGFNLDFVICGVSDSRDACLAHSALVALMN
jgi:hypothetical protein